MDLNESDDDEYSTSANFILQKHATKPGSTPSAFKRRTSCTFSTDEQKPETSDYRRSSVLTTSSGDTAITIDEMGSNEPPTQEQILENIKLHKEVLANVKYQPWNMRKKVKLVIQAKNYIKKHEGELQERLAKSRSTRDMLARWKMILVKKLQRCRREMANIPNWFIPWEWKIKAIESHFGSVVASYFIFLRWLFWVNCVLAIILISFVTVPEVLTTDPNAANDRKFILPEDKYNSTNFLTLWDFEGIFKYSPLFYGWYTNQDSGIRGYRLPFAYFVTGILAYAYSFFATLRKMAQNSRLSKLSEKGDECVFSWKLFTAWDFMIGNTETAQNRVASIVMGFKEALLEEAEKKRQSRNWKIICLRTFVNIFVLGLLMCSAYAVVLVVKRSTEPKSMSTVWRRNEITVVLSLISLFFPMLFELLGMLEKYHPRKQLRLQLARIMVLNLLNLYSLIFALFDKIDDMTNELQDFKNISPRTSNQDAPPFLPTLDTNLTSEICFNICSTFDKTNTFPKHLIANLIANFSLENFNEDGFKNSTDTNSYWNTTTIPNNTTTLYDLSTTVEEFSNSSNDDYWSFLQNPFIDYLTYILSDFGDNSTTVAPVLLNNYSNATESNMSTESVESNSENYPNTTLKLTNILNDIVTNNMTTNNQGSFLNSSLDTNYFVTETETEDDFSSDIYFEEETTTISTEIVSYSPFPKLNENITYVNKEITSNDDVINPVRIQFNNKSSITSEDDDIESTPLIYSSKNQKNCTLLCEQLSKTLMPTISKKEMNASEKVLSYTSKSRLRSLCWETMFGQELVKLTVMDLIMTLFSTLTIDFLRGLFVRFMNKCWCWDLEKTFPQYGDFKVAENILHLVNNQGLVWMGLFFSPGLVVLNVVKLYALMYLRAWAVLTCNSPPEVIFRASRSNNFYYGLLLMMLFLCVLPVGYAIVWIKPSWHCGPFSEYQRIYHIFTTTIKDNVPVVVKKSLDYIASPGIIIPLLVLLTLIIYYLISLTGALREANTDLKAQLRRERTEERRKMFQLATHRKKRGGLGDYPNSPFGKWVKLLSSLPGGTKNMDDASKQEGTCEQPTDRKQQEKNRVAKSLLSKLVTFKARTKQCLNLKLNPSTSQVADTNTYSIVEMTTINNAPSTSKDFIPSIKISENIDSDSDSNSNSNGTTNKSTTTQVILENQHLIHNCNDENMKQNDNERFPNDI